jgi:hypothetical protein
VPEGGSARFNNLQLLGPPGEKFMVYFTLQQISATASSEQLQSPTLSPGLLGALSSPLLVQLPACKAGQVVRLSSQGLASGCTSCSAPLFSFNPRSSACTRCPSQSLKCGGAQMLPKSGYFQWHPLSPQLLECPDARACKPDAAALQRMQEIQAAAVASVAVGGGQGGSARRKLTSVAAAVVKTTTPGSSSSSNANSSSISEFEYQQLQCTEGYTGPLCASCFSAPSSLTSASAATASGVSVPAKRYGRYHQACKSCPRQGRLPVLYYILARLLDLSIVAVLVALVAHERRKRLRKLTRQPTPTLTAQQRRPGALVRAIVSAWDFGKQCCDHLIPQQLRGTWAMAPLLMSEKGRPAKKSAMSSDLLVQVGGWCLSIFSLGCL